MSTTLKATFETRREAEMAVERLVQEHGLERADIFIVAEGPENTAGEAPSGSDRPSAAPSPPPSDDAPLEGPIAVSVDINDEAHAAAVRAAFREFRAEAVAEG